MNAKALLQEDVSCNIPPSKEYDPASCLALDLFNPIKRNIECPFAKRSRLWGAPEWDSHATLEENIVALSSTLTEFIHVSLAERLDGYVVAAPKIYGESLQKLSCFTKRVLIQLSLMDSSDLMAQNIAGADWQFTYKGMRLFITTFAACYPQTSSRYGWGTRMTFLLLQPEHSFESSHIPKGSGDQIRHAVREAFKNAARDYYDPKIIDAPCDAVKYVKPLKLGGSPVEWWKEKE